MSEESIAVVDRVVQRVPTLRPAFDEHLADNFGEVLPHLFMADVARHALCLYRATTSSSIHAETALEELRCLLEAVEKEFAAGCDEVRNMISVSFIEMLPRRGEREWDIRCLLGDSLRRELESMG